MQVPGSPTSETRESYSRFTTQVKPGLAVPPLRLGKFSLASKTCFVVLLVPRSFTSLSEKRMEWPESLLV